MGRRAIRPEQLPVLDQASQLLKLAPPPSAPPWSHAGRGRKARESESGEGESARGEIDGMSFTGS